MEDTGYGSICISPDAMLALIEDGEGKSDVGCKGCEGG